MTIQRFEVAVGDSFDDITKSAAGTVTAGHAVRVEYDDTISSDELVIALGKARDKVLQLEEG